MKLPVVGAPKPKLPSAPRFGAQVTVNLLHLNGEFGDRVKFQDREVITDEIKAALGPAHQARAGKQTFWGYSPQREEFILTGGGGDVTDADREMIAKVDDVLKGYEFDPDKSRTVTTDPTVGNIFRADRNRTFLTMGAPDKGDLLFESDTGRLRCITDERHHEARRKAEAAGGH